MKKNKTIMKWIALITSISMIILCIGYLAWKNQKNFEKTIVTQTQQQLLVAAKSIALSIENFFTMQQGILKSLASDPTLSKLTLDTDFSQFEMRYKELKGDIGGFYLISPKGIVTHRYPNKEKVGKNYSNKPGVSAVLKNHKPYISKLFVSGSGKSCLSVSEPILLKGKFIGVIRALTYVKTIQKKYIASINIDKKSYAQVIDDEGMVLMHSQTGHIGENFITFSKEKLPQNIRVPLTKLVGKMTNGEEGVDIYQSTVKVQEKIKTKKQLVAYAPIHIGDALWSIGISIDYSEISAPIKTHSKYTFYLMLFVIGFISTGGFILHNAQRKKAASEERVKHLEEINKTSGALVKSEKKYRFLAESMMDVIVQISSEGQLLYVSPSMKNFGGYDPTDLIGNHMAEYFENESDLIRAFELLKRISKTHQSGTFEFLLKAKNKKAFPVELTYFPIIKDNTVISIQFVLRDITERKQAEEAMRLMKYSIDRARDCLFWIDSSACITYVNNATCDLLGYSSEELLSMDITKVDPSVSLTDWPDRLIKLEDIRSDRYESQHLTKDGQLIPVEVTSSYIAYEGEKGILSFTRDITEQKKAEEMLESSRQKLALHFLQAPLAVIEWDLEFRVRSWNPTAERIFGYAEKEIIGKHASIIIPKQYKDHIDAVWAELLQQKSGNRSTNENITQKGDLIFCEWSNTPIINETGETIAVFSLVQDITSRIQAEKAKERLEFQLQQAQKMESIGTLAGGIAHDFNNILFPILGNTELLFMDTDKSSPAYARLEKIYAGANRAKELVTQILTFSRQDQIELKLLKIQPVIKEALKLIRSTIPTIISIKNDIRSDCGPIKADPTQIHQIVMNLATNAYHAMEETGGELQVTLGEINLKEHDLLNLDIPPGIYACLTVTDTGIGIEKELINKIFDPFFTTKKVGKGTGMGMSVVHGIVKSMNGIINVYSEPGKGTEFNVYFPVEKLSSEKHNKQTDIPMQTGTEHILLVDDEKDILTMEKEMLARLGYKVSSRGSSIEALEAFKASSNKFDLVITDMQMPNISGIKLAAEFIKIRPDIPVLLCTGFSETMFEEKAASLGIKGFLLKPIVMKDLARKIRELLDNQKSMFSV